MSEYSERIRKDWALLNSIRQKEFRQPDDITAYRNLQYREPGPYDSRHGWNLLDLYVPDNYSGKLPVIMSFHGGSYVYGSKDMYQYYLMSVSQRGFAVVNFNYRLAPEFKFPTAFEDVNLVVKWIKENAEKYNLDVNNIFLIGDSAGAHYASLYTLICTNPDYAELIGVKPYDKFVPKAVGLNCGFYKLNWFFFLVPDFGFAIHDVLGESALKKKKVMLNGKYVKLKKFINVNEYFTKDFPPAFVMTGGFDFVRFQIKYIEKLLKKFNIPYVAKTYGSRNDKDAIHNFHADLNCKLSKVCNDDECNFFKSLIKTNS